MTVSHRRLQITGRRHSNDEASASPDAIEPSLKARFAHVRPDRRQAPMRLPPITLSARRRLPVNAVGYGYPQWRQKFVVNRKTYRAWTSVAAANEPPRLVTHLAALDRDERHAKMHTAPSKRRSVAVRSARTPDSTPCQKAFGAESIRYRRDPALLNRRLDGQMLGQPRTHRQNPARAH